MYPSRTKGLSWEFGISVMKSYLVAGVFAAFIKSVALHTPFSSRSFAHSSVVNPSRKVMVVVGMAVVVGVRRSIRLLSDEHEVNKKANKISIGIKTFFSKKHHLDAYLLQLYYNYFSFSSVASNINWLIILLLH